MSNLRYWALMAAVLGIGGCLLANQPPTAVVGADRFVAQSGGRIDFSGYDCRDPDGDIVRYRWDFGDGAVENSKYVSHAYANPGSYTVTLTVWDDDGASNTATAVIAIEQGPVVSDFRVTGTRFAPSTCWLIFSWPCIYAYATVVNAGAIPGRVEIEVEVYDSMGAVAGRGNLSGPSCVSPGESVVVEGKVFDVWGPVDSVTRAQARVVSVSPCD